MQSKERQSEMNTPSSLSKFTKISKNESETTPPLRLELPRMDLYSAEVPPS
jgi:hypothetical protein